jgi:hypothetical protein
MSIRFGLRPGVTGIHLEGPSCSYDGDGNLRDETSNGELGCGGDLDEEGGRVEALPGEEDPLAGEQECLVPLLSSIVNKWRRERKILEEKWSTPGWVKA